jgi:hypothetical protein
LSKGAGNAKLGDVTPSKIIWAVACESAEIDAQGRLSARQIMNAYWLPRFPCVLEKMCLFGVATGEPNGEFELSISVVPPRGTQPQLMKKHKGRLGPAGNTPFQVNLLKIGFPQHGKYAFHLAVPGQDPFVVDVSLFQAMPNPDSNNKN